MGRKYAKREATHQTQCLPMRARTPKAKRIGLGTTLSFRSKYAAKRKPNTKAIFTDISPVATQ
jgi:hypothetical protein